MLGLVSVEVASGALKSLLAMETPSTSSTRDKEELCVQAISSRTRLKLEKYAVKTKSSPTPNVRLSFSPATGAATTHNGHYESCVLEFFKTYLLVQ